jgi:hypothetical protein
MMANRGTGMRGRSDSGNSGAVRACVRQMVQAMPRMLRLADLMLRFRFRGRAGRDMRRPTHACQRKTYKKRRKRRCDQTRLQTKNARSLEHRCDLLPGIYNYSMHARCQRPVTWPAAANFADTTRLSAFQQS